MKKLHYSWLICAACTLILFCTIGFTATTFSVYLPYIIDVGGLSKARGSTIIMIRSLTSLFFIPAVGKYYCRFNIRLGLMLMLLTLVISLVIYSQTKNFVGYCIAAAISGICYGLGGMIPVSILINRWFHSHRVLALGICAAGSGAAAFIMPPVLTTLVEIFTLPFAFLTQAIFVGVVAVISFIVLRNAPEEKNLSPLQVKQEIFHKNVESTGNIGEIDRKILYRMYIAVAFLGFGIYGAVQNISTLYTGEGFDSTTVSLFMSSYGFALLTGKLLYGHLTDSLGAYKSGFIFFSLLVIGCALCCFAGHGNTIIAMSSMIALGLGTPLATVGLSVFAKDMSVSGDYASMIKYFQFYFMVGSTLIGPIPGAIADLTESYVLSYALFTVLITIAMLFIQLSYRQIQIHKVKMDYKNTNEPRA
jgi:predicted MFS family arabinose efflux permease